MKVDLRSSPFVVPSLSSSFLPRYTCPTASPSPLSISRKQVPPYPLRVPTSDSGCRSPFALSLIGRWVIRAWQSLLNLYPLPSSPLLFPSDMAKGDLSVSDIESLQTAGIYLLKLDYIAEYLVQDPPPQPRNYLLPEVSKTLQGNAGRQEGGVTEQRKRKAGQLTADAEKRARVN